MCSENITEILFKKVENAFYHWDEDSLKSLLETVSNNQESEKFNKLFLLTKIYFQLAFCDYEKKQGNYTKKFRNDDESNKGYMNYSVEYGGKAFKLIQKNTELNYYLTKGFQTLIYNVDTYFQYKDKMNKYRDQNQNKYSD